MFTKYACILCAMCLFLAGLVWAGPELTIKDDNFNFGIIPQNVKVTGGFWLYSSGSETLNINKVKPACGCTKAPLKKNTMAPGDSTFLEFEFNSSKYNKKVTKSIRIFSNDTDSLKKVTLSCMVANAPQESGLAVIKPNQLQLKQMGNKIRSKMEFFIENITDHDLEYEYIFYPDEYFELKLPKKIKAGQTAKGILTIKSDHLNDGFEKSFTIEFNDANKTRYSIPVVNTVN